MKNCHRTFITVCLLLSVNEASGKWEQTGWPHGGPVNAIAVSGTTVIAGTEFGGIYMSTNNGDSWRACNAGLPHNPRMFNLAVCGGNVFAVIDQGVYKWSENGTLWKWVDVGFGEGLWGWGVAVNGDTVLAYNSRLVSLSTDKGETWKADSLWLEEVAWVAASGGNIIVDYGGLTGLRVSHDRGKSWSEIPQAGFGRISDLVAGGGMVYAATDSGIFRSPDNGISWTAANAGLTDSSVGSLLISGDTLYAATRSGVFVSRNKGASWAAAANTGIRNAFIYGLAKNGATLFATTDSGVLRSTNSCASWTAVNAGIANTYVNRLYTSGNAVFAEAQGGLYRSMDRCASWTALPVDKKEKDVVTCFAACPGALFVATDYYNDSLKKMVYTGTLRSTDNGATWARVDIGLTLGYVSGIAAHGDTVFAGTHGDGVFRSTNNGMSWTAAGLPGSSISTIAVIQGKVFADVFNHGVYVSTSFGESWTAAGIAAESGFAVNGDKIFANDFYSGYFSSNIGASWARYQYPGCCPYFTLTAAVFDGTGDNIFGAGHEGVFLSTDNGASWTAVNDEVLNSSVNALAVIGDTLYASTSYFGLIRRPVSEMISTTGLKKQKKSLLPGKMCLLAGTPSGVLVNYEVPSRSIVRMELFAVSGERVAVRDMGEQAPGGYRIRLDGALTSGVYVFRFQAGNYRESTLMKVMK